MIPSISIENLLNENDTKKSFLIDSFDNMPEPENMVYPHKHNFYEILWILEGESKQTIDYKDYKISSNTLFFISPGQLHLFEKWDNIKAYCILFNEDFFLQNFSNKNILFELSYLDNLYENPYLELNDTDKKNIEPIVNLLLQENQEEKINEDSIQALLLVLLRRIQKIASSHTKVKNNNTHLVILKQFKKLIEENYHKKLSIEAYASMLSITAYQLNKITKEICNKTASSIINEQIILEAQSMLNFSELNISQIADKLGFEDSSYFARFFKKYTNKTPLEFKSKFEKKYPKGSLLS